VPILSLGAIALAPGQTIAQKWKSDLEAGWRATWETTSKIYGGKGLVESVSDTLENTLNVLRDRYKFNHPKGEVPEALAQEWFKGWEASTTPNSFIKDPLKLSGTIPGFMQYGHWNFVFQFARAYYLDNQITLEMNKMATDAATLLMEAKRAVAKMNLDLYGKILSGYGSRLSTDEKEFLKYYFLEMEVLKSEADKARATSILTRIGFTYTTTKQIEEELHKVFLHAGGKEEDWMKYRNSSTESIISNGSSKPITAVDWNDVQANQKVVTAVTDEGYVSPLNTMFLKPAVRTQASATDQPTPVTPQFNPVLLAGGAWLLFKLLRR